MQQMERSRLLEPSLDIRSKPEISLQSIGQLWQLAPEGFLEHRPYVRFLIL
jgi:hypothetical protein